MKLDNQPALVGGYAFLARLTHRPIEAVVWLARRIGTLMDQEWSKHGIRLLVRDDLDQKPWQW